MKYLFFLLVLFLLVGCTETSVRFPEGCPDVCVQYYDVRDDCKYEDCASGCTEWKENKMFGDEQECLEALALRNAQ